MGLRILGGYLRFLTKFLGEFMGFLNKILRVYKFLKIILRRGYAIPPYHLHRVHYIGVSKSVFSLDSLRHLSEKQLSDVFN
jgi:hypothetical protein